MKIGVGSTNPVKVGAVEEMAPQYDLLVGAEILAVNAESSVSEQPISIDETVRGAMNRANTARAAGCDLGFGIESGLIEVPHTKTGMLDLCACAIYDGEEYHIGLSPAFECPIRVIELIRNEGMDLNQAFYTIGMTDNPKVGSAEGVISLLTKGRLTRKEYTKQAILMAMIHLENAEFYRR